MINMIRHPAEPASGSIPKGPGVYKFESKDGRILYVGKAKNLNLRIDSYFRTKSDKVHQRTSRMLDEATLVNWVVCASEAEALILEATWIKTLQPTYNVMLKDSSPYPRLAISTNEEFPRLLPWRGERKKGYKYFGPFPHLRVRTLMDTLTKAFPIRSCNKSVFRRAEISGRPCMLADLNRCSAPCVGRIDTADHAKIVTDLTNFLQGKSDFSLVETENNMIKAAELQNYELAGRLRDRLNALRSVGFGQSAVFSNKIDADSFATLSDGYNSIFGWALARGGSVINSGFIYYYPDVSINFDMQISQLISVFYLDNQHEVVPSNKIYLELEIDKSYIALNNHKEVSIKVPKSGDALHLLGFAQRQAIEGIRLSKLHRSDSIEDRHAALEELSGVIGSGTSLRRIEGIDISHTQGKHTVGGLVSFVDGTENRGDYRRINLSTDDGDDYAALAELVTRRYSGNYLGLATFPDMLLVDGGPVQLAAVAKAIDKINPEHRPIICAIAKRMEELFLEGEQDPVILPRSASSFILITRVRDAVHNSAIIAHRKRRDKVDSTFENIPGIGRVRRNAVLKKFGTLEAAKSASITDLVQVQGIGNTTARIIFTALHPESDK